MDNRIAEEDIFAVKDNNEIGRKYTEIERLGKTLWQSDYARDIFESMKEQEQRRRPLQGLSTQMDERQKTMQLLQDVNRTCKLSRCAMHLAVYYLDRFADQYKIRPDKFPLVGLICLHIAAQIESADALVPRYSELNRFVQGAYTASEYKVVERKILCFFNFELMRPTTASFVEMFTCSFLTRADFLDYIRMLDEYEREHNIVPYERYRSFEHMLTTLAQLLLRLANCTLHIATFGNVLPSLLAAACIAAVRQVNGVKRWSQYLTDLTTYTEADVESHTETITMYYYYQITPPQVVAVAEEAQEELTICDNASGQSNPQWSSPESGFEEPLTASAGFNEASTAHTGFKEGMTAHTGFKEASSAHTDFKEGMTAHTGFKEASTAHTGFKEAITTHTGFKEASTAHTGFKEAITTHTGFNETITTHTDFKEGMTAHTSFKEASTAHTGFKEAITTHTSFKEASTALTGFKEASTAHTGFKEPVTSHTSFEEPLNTYTGFKEPLTEHTYFKEPVTSHTSFEDPLYTYTGLKEPLTEHTYFKEPSTAHTGFKEPLTEHTYFKEPSTAHTDLKEPLTACTHLKASLTASTHLKASLTASTDFKEPLLQTKNFVVLNNGISMEVETYSIISVQLQEPACPTTPTPTTMPYYDLEATLKRRCQEDDIEDGVPQPSKQPKLVTKPED